MNDDKELTAQEHRTDDLYECAFYMIRGCKLIHQESIGRRIMFVLEGQDLPSLVGEWKGGRPIGNLIHYSTFIKKLKIEITTFLKSTGVEKK